MPSASVTTTVAASPLRDEAIEPRRACPGRTLRRRRTSGGTRGTSHRIADREDVAEFLNAARRAASGSSPCSIRSLTLRAQVAADLLVELAFVGPHELLVARRGGVHDSADGMHQLRPAITFTKQLSLAVVSEPGNTLPLIGLVTPHSEVSHPRFSEPVQRRIKASRSRLSNKSRRMRTDFADAWPCRGPHWRVRRTSTSRVPWRSSRRYRRNFGHGCRTSNGLDVDGLQHVPRLRSRLFVASFGGQARFSLDQEAK